MSTLFHYLLTTVVLVMVTGLYTLLATRNMIRVLISLEILMKGVTLLIITAGFVTGKTEQAQAMVITLIIVEVVAVAVAACIIVSLHRHGGSLDAENTGKVKEG